MRRTEETQDLLNMVADLSKQCGDTDSVNRIVITPLLSDIAMSLAVIADNLKEKKENKNEP